MWDPILRCIHTEPMAFTSSPFMIPRIKYLSRKLDLIVSIYIGAFGCTVPLKIFVVPTIIISIKAIIGLCASLFLCLIMPIVISGFPEMVCILFYLSLRSRLRTLVNTHNVQNTIDLWIFIWSTIFPSMCWVRTTDPLSIVSVLWSVVLLTLKPLNWPTLLCRLSHLLLFTLWSWLPQ